MLLTGVSTTDSYLQFITVLLLFVFVLVITYATTRWISGYQKNKAVYGNLELVETLRIANNKYIQIVRVGKKYLAIAVGKDEVHMLSELEQDDLTFYDSQTKELDFGSILEKFKKQNGKEHD